MEVKELIGEQTVEAFELFVKTIDKANLSTLSIAIKNISADLGSKYFYLESEQKKKVFKSELERISEIINKESEKIISEWFEKFVLNDKEI